MPINLEALKADLKRKNSNASKLERFESLLVIYLGVEPREWYSKMKDSEGNTLKDNNGNAMRSPVASGYTYTFSELGTSRVIKIVLSKKINIELLNLYILSGNGYNIKQSNMVFMQENGEIRRYEQK